MAQKAGAARAIASRALPGPSSAHPSLVDGRLEQAARRARRPQTSVESRCRRRAGAKAALLWRDGRVLCGALPLHTRPRIATVLEQAHLEELLFGLALAPRTETGISFLSERWLWRAYALAR